MALSPQEIVRKEFREAFRGYNQADVDLFLDELVEEYSRMSDENQKMKVRLAALQQEVARFKEGRVTPQTVQAGADAQPDPQRVDSEVRARVRRFFEDQLRTLESSPAPTSPTAERIARELPRSPDAPEARRVAHPAPPVSVEGEDAKTRSREPFWAGE